MAHGYAYQGEALAPGYISGRRWVRLWLIGVALLISGLILVGGATRLTDSGLSITEWRPITGIIPPLSEEEWFDEFIKYQGIPEYQLINQGMNIDEFKRIYWWEWGHRMFARLVGLAFALPLMVFALRGWIDRPLGVRLVGILLLGGAQAFLGWLMVQSGFDPGDVDVSQYKLAAHLGLAFVIFGAVVWTICSLERSGDGPLPKIPRRYRWFAGGLAALVFVQIIAGAFVAGLDAGLTYNTWPLMDGEFIPDGLGIMQPVYLNLFENVLTVQFNHRMLAYALVVLAIVYAISLAQFDAKTAIGTSGLWFAAGVIGQAVLGVITLLAAVPISLGLLHQGGAIVVFALILHHLFLITHGSIATATAGSQQVIAEPADGSAEAAPDQQS